MWRDEGGEGREGRRGDLAKGGGEGELELATGRIFFFSSRDCDAHSVGIYIERSIFSLFDQSEDLLPESEGF